MKRSKRIETLDKRPVNLDGYINEWPEMGFAAMSSPYDPEPSVRVENGKIVELDGKMCIRDSSHTVCLVLSSGIWIHFPDT